MWRCVGRFHLDQWLGEWNNCTAGRGGGFLGAAPLSIFLYLGVLLGHILTKSFHRSSLRKPARDSKLAEEIRLRWCRDHRSFYISILRYPGKPRRWHPGQILPPWVDEPHPTPSHLPIQRATPAPPPARDQQPVEVAWPGADGADHTPLRQPDDLEQVHRCIVLALVEHGPLDARYPNSCGPGYQAASPACPGPAVRCTCGRASSRPQAAPRAGWRSASRRGQPRSRCRWGGVSDAGRCRQSRSAHRLGPGAPPAPRPSPWRNPASYLAPVALFLLPHFSWSRIASNRSGCSRR